MALNLSNMSEGGQGFEVPAIEKDTYIGVIVGIIDLGKQMKTVYNEKNPKDQQPEIGRDGNPVYSDRGLFVVEIPSQKFVQDYEEENEQGVKEQKTFEFIRRVYKEVSFTTGDQSGLMTTINDLQAMPAIQAAKGEITAMLGMKAMVTIDYTTGGNVKVKAITKVPSMMKSVADSTEAETPFYHFTPTLDTDENVHVFNEVIGDGMRTRIRSCKDWDKTPLAAVVDAVNTSGDAAVDDATKSLLG